MLQSIYRGSIVPHVRPLRELTEAEDHDGVDVVFVGSPKAHKGIDELRGAVASLAQDGFRLTVTGTAPSDAKPWETWVGTIAFADGMQLVDRSDVVVIPSKRTSWSMGQLPAKLMDAMMAGKAVVVTDVGPMPWAVGDAGLVVPAGEALKLREALMSLKDRQMRRELGLKARKRAERDYSVESGSSNFKEACDMAAHRKEESK